MEQASFAARLDHTSLGTETTLSDVKEALDTAVHHDMNACVPPCYVAEALEYAPETTITTVCGFPQGQNEPEAKEFEAECAWKSGVDELEVVINIGEFHAGNGDAVSDELDRVIGAVPIPVTITIEAPLLSVGELRTAGELAADAGAAALNTATGFLSGGATVEDVEIMSEYLPVKATGGIETFEDAVTMLEAGATRIGTPAGQTIIEGFDAGTAGSSSLGSGGE